MTLQDVTDMLTAAMVAGCPERLRALATRFVATRNELLWRSLGHVEDQVFFPGPIGDADAATDDFGGPGAFTRREAVELWGHAWEAWLAGLLQVVPFERAGMLERLAYKGGAPFNTVAEKCDEAAAYLMDNPRPARRDWLARAA